MILLLVFLLLGIFFEICIFGEKNFFIGLLFGVLLEFFNDVVIFEFSDLNRGLEECWFWDCMEGFVNVLLMVVVVLLVFVLFVGKLVVKEVFS